MEMNQVLRSGHKDGPFVRTRSKTRYSAHDEERAILRAVRANIGIPHIMPVYYGGKLLAFTEGDRYDRGVVRWRYARSHELLEAAITTYEGVATQARAGFGSLADWYRGSLFSPVANNYYDLWPVSGKPAGGTYTGTAATARPHDRTTIGALMTPDVVSPSVRLTTMAHGKHDAGTTTPPTIYLYDRVLTYELSPFTAASSQAMTNTLPATRYVGAGESGLLLMVTGQTVTGATASDITVLTYVDQNGNADALVPQTPAISTIVSAAAPTAGIGARVIAPATAAGTIPWGAHMPLAAGDSGMRSITNYTTSAANTGTMCMVLYKPICTIPLEVASKVTMIDLAAQTPGLMRLYDDACLAAMAFIITNTGSAFVGGLGMVWG